MQNSLKLYLAVPVLNEYENLPELLDCILKQSYTNYEVVFCVNQYESWWDEDQYKRKCKDNGRSMEYLRDRKLDNVRIIDRSSKGNGWTRKHGGVGWARKVIMDDISDQASADDIIISMDADTYYPEDFLAKIAAFYQENPRGTGLSIPYYHKLCSEATNNRLILRYEIYMRYYAHNLIRIKNPYAFTALGSAIALSVETYRKIGGITPVKSGEDFYLLQKLVKTAKLATWVNTTTYPSARFSDRVLFGTGPALIKGNSGDWDSYPFYLADSFDKVGNTFGKFETLYTHDLKLPMDAFFNQQFGKEDFWLSLRHNYKDRKNFVKACQNKVDGLRILQFLRWDKDSTTSVNESTLTDYLLKHAVSKLPDSIKTILKKINFEKTSIEELNQLRDWMFEEESKLRKNNAETK